MNYKIKVNSEAESREVQELFFELGREWSPGESEIKHTNKTFILMHGVNSMGYCSTQRFFDNHEAEETTLPQLRDKVVLHRNDVRDATHTDQDDWKWLVASDGKAYVFAAGNAENKQRWDESPLDHVDLKPINKSKSEVDVENLISGKDALIALANGEGVQYSHKTKAEDIFFNDLTINSTVRIDEIFSGYHFIFRLKPKTILLNGIEVPAPFNPEDGDAYWHLDLDYEEGYASHSYIDDGSWIQFGAWRTESEIKQVVEALRTVFGGVK